MRLRQRNNMFTRALLILITLALGATSSSAQNETQALNSIALSYTINLVSSKFGNATVGQLHTSLTQDLGSYSAHSTTKAQGLAAILVGDQQMSCDFSVEQGRALSRNYAGGSTEADEYQVSYDWDARKIHFGDNESLDMPPGYVIDLCNMPFAAALLKDDGLADEVLYVLNGERKIINSYKLRSSAKETLDTPVGSMDTIKIILEREFKPDRTYSLWLSLDHGYVPVKMEDARSSRTITFMVNEIEPS